LRPRRISRSGGGRLSYFNGTELRSLTLATGLLLLGAAARLGLGPGPAEFAWQPADSVAGQSAASLEHTRRQVGLGVAEEEVAGTPLAKGERLDPNVATAAQLRRLPGVGRAKAEAIVSERTTGKPFEGPADLARVPGIGPQTVEALTPHLEFGSRGSTRSPAPGAAGLPGSAPLVNVNRAQIKELEQITGIGPVLAARIVENRQRLGRFESAEDLARVPGIGPVLVGRIRGQVRF